MSGLDLGADDYLAKPFHLAELSARIKSVMRRNRGKWRKYDQVGKCGRVARINFKYR